MEKAADGSIDTTRTLSSIETFDRKCNLVEDKEYKGDFVDDEHPVRIDATTLLIHSNMGDKTQRERYDAAGNLVEVWITKSTGEFEEQSINSYDIAGRMIRSSSFDADGKPDGSTIYTNDINGRTLRDKTHFGDGRTQTETFTYEFDARGNAIKK